MENTLYFYEKDNIITCTLCPTACTLKNQTTGSCQIRKNINNTLIATTFQKFCSLAIDPIEKKPLYHFYPGEKTLSLGSIGCNFHCKHCQNWQISQPHKLKVNPSLQTILVDDIVNYAKTNNINIVAFTYNEPLIQIETLLNCLPQLKDAGLKTVLVTNLYINQAPLEAILPYTDALSIDIKAFSQKKYQKLTTKNALESIKKNVEICFIKQKHIELVTNLVTNINDNIETLTKINDWIIGISKHIPWHISCFHPDFEYTNLQPISLDFLTQVEKFKRESLLSYIYTKQNQNTYCPNCKKEIINREAFVIKSTIQSITCPYCKKEVPYLYV